MKHNERLVDNVVNAWTDPGPQPAYHAAVVDDLRKRWPVLARALDNLVTYEGLEIP